MSKSTGPDWLSTKQTCELLGITLRTLYRLIDTGQIPAYQFGRVIRLRRHEVDAFIEQQRIEPGTISHLYPEPATPRPPKETPTIDVPTAQPQPLTFMVTKSKRGVYRFTALDADRRVLLRSEPFATKQECIEALAIVRASAPDAVVEDQTSQ